MGLPRVFAVCAWVAVAAPAASDAATITATTGRTGTTAATQLNVVAAPGERNDLVVSQQTDASVVLSDPGATFRAQTPFCTIVSPHEARCMPTADAGLIERVEVDLGDEGDRATTPTGERLPVTFAGGAGNDELTGSTRRPAASPAMPGTTS